MKLSNQTFHQHITEPTVIVVDLSGLVVENNTFKATGASYGRIIFKHSPMLEVKAENVTFTNNVFQGGI